MPQRRSRLKGTVPDQIIRMSDSSRPLNFAGGEILLWAESGGPIMLKCVTPHGNPTEVFLAEARALAKALSQLADWCEGLGDGGGAR